MKDEADDPTGAGVLLRAGYWPDNIPFLNLNTQELRDYDRWASSHQLRWPTTGSAWDALLRPDGVQGKQSCHHLI